MLERDNEGVNSPRGWQRAPTDRSPIGVTRIGVTRNDWITEGRAPDFALHVLRFTSAGLSPLKSQVGRIFQNDGPPAAANKLRSSAGRFIMGNHF